MKNTSFFLIPLFLIVTVFVVGCSSEPMMELTAAQQAINQAEEAEADLFVNDLYESARDSLAAAQAEMNTQGAKLAMLRNYNHARRLLVVATETAAEATAQVSDRKQVMITETETIIAEAQQALDNVQTLLSKAPTGKEGRMALVSIGEDRSSAQFTLNEAKAALLNGDVIEAHRQASVSLDKANSLVIELEAAIARTSRS